MKNPLAFLFDKTESDEHVPNREIMSYATGLAGQNISYSYVSNRLTYFYENHAVSDAHASVVGKIMSASHIWDAINDIVVGAYVDRRKHKPYRKLRPYLLWLPPFIGIFGALMFIDMGNNDIFNLIMLGVFYAVWDLLYSFQDVALWGQIALSSPHSHERSRVAQWVSIGASAGSVLAGAFPVIWDVLKKVSVPEKTIFTTFGIIFVLGGELISVRAYKFRERVDAPIQENESIWESISILRHNPTLLLISLARFSQGLTPNINQSYFFQSEYRNMKSDLLKGGMAETLYGIVGGIPGAIAVFFANPLIDFVGGMKKLLIISQITAIVTRLVGFGICSIPAVKYNTVPGFFIMSLIIAVCNVPGSLMDIAHRSLTSDSIDEVELKTGIRSEGVSFSMQNFTSKMTNGVRTLIQNKMLFGFLGYKTYDDENYIAMQSEKFYKWQFPMFMLAPIVGSVLYIICIAFVRDDKQHRAQVEQALRERRKKASVAEA